MLAGASLSAQKEQGRLCACVCVCVPQATGVRSSTPTPGATHTDESCHYNSVWAALTRIIETEGVKGLFKGMKVRVCVCMCVCVCFVCVQPAQLSYTSALCQCFCARGWHYKGWRGCVCVCVCVCIQAKMMQTVLGAALLMAIKEQVSVRHTHTRARTHARTLRFSQARNSTVCLFMFGMSMYGTCHDLAAQTQGRSPALCVCVCVCVYTQVYNSVRALSKATSLPKAAAALG